MIKLKYEKKRFRLNPKLYKIINEAQFKIGEMVEIIKKSSIGQNMDVGWHKKDDAPFLLLEIDGKWSGKRFKNYDMKEVR